VQERFEGRGCGVATGGRVRGLLRGTPEPCWAQVLPLLLAAWAGPAAASSPAAKGAAGEGALGRRGDLKEGAGDPEHIQEVEGVGEGRRRQARHWHGETLRTRAGD